MSWSYDEDMSLLSKKDRETFVTDGFVVLRGLVPLEALTSIEKGVEANLANPSPWANDYTPAGSGGRFFDDYVSWQRIEPFADAALRGVLPQIAGELMETTSPRFFHEHVLVKEPGTATPTPWHHDDPYYGVEGTDNVSLWIPLDPVPEEIALRCIRGSHRVPRRFIPNRFVDDSPYTEAADGFELFPSQSELEALGDSVVCAAQPGDVVAFHFRTLHSAPATTNHPSRRRIVSFRYVGDDARWITRPWKTSPPFEPLGLNDGDVLDEVRFPIVTL
jgi:ectoine hydroxylase-related dioxygenase (phytanoyl-CoA dioxygenase family)